MIEIQNLVKQFTLGDEVITAVNHANLTVDAGDFLSIIGPSGSGKSTLMNIIGMLDNADEGTYLFDGKDVTGLSDDEQASIRNESIGFVFQSFHLLQKLTAVENVMVPLLYRNVSEKEAKRKAVDMLEKLGMGQRVNHLPNQLSGGQQQRVAIARALAGQPRLLLADEPTGALDQHTGKEILKLLKELNEEGQTIVLITHDNGIARQTSRIVRIEDGVMREENPSGVDDEVGQVAQDIESADCATSADGSEAELDPTDPSVTGGIDSEVDDEPAGADLPVEPEEESDGLVQSAAADDIDAVDESDIDREEADL